MNINTAITNQPLPSAPNLDLKNVNIPPQGIQPPLILKSPVPKAGFLLQPNQSSSFSTTEEAKMQEEAKKKKDDVKTTKSFCGITLSDAEDDCMCCCFLCKILRRPLSDYVGGCVGDYFKGSIGEGCCSGFGCKDGCCEGGCTGCCDGCTGCCDDGTGCCDGCTGCCDGCAGCCDGCTGSCNEESCGCFVKCIEACCDISD